MTDDLEQRYRHALRWYPRRWRARHEAALLGILLDQAEEEGRTHMSSIDRHDLARHGLRRRLSPPLLGVLVVLVILAAAQIASMVSFGNRLDTELFMVGPRISERSMPMFDIDFQAGALYTICAMIVIGATIGSVLVVRRMRRA